MKFNKIVSFIGIFGVVLFAISSIVGGFLIENYSIASQLISETYAIDTEYGFVLRTYGIIPSGGLISFFCFLALRHFKNSKLTRIGFLGLGIFYGIATVIVGIFPCDSGCNIEFIDPSISQLIHTLTGLLTYIFVPISIIIIGLGLRNVNSYSKLSTKAILYGIVSILFIALFLSNPSSGFIGFYQRFIEFVFIIWIVNCAIVIKNESN